MNGGKKCDKKLQNMENKEERSLFRDECNKKATEMKVIYNIDDIYLYK